MKSCLFCNIIEKKEQAYIIYENERVCCFLDADPINKGHILIVPKKHYAEFTEVDSHCLTEIILIAQQMARIMAKLLHVDGITIMQNNGIFNDIGHYHMHIFPRFEGDGFSWIDPDIEIHEGEFEVMMGRFIEGLNEGLK